MGNGFLQNFNRRNWRAIIWKTWV